jgi:hypothetical protein
MLQSSRVVASMAVENTGCVGVLHCHACNKESRDGSSGPSLKASNSIEQRLSQANLWIESKLQIRWGTKRTLLSLKQWPEDDLRDACVEDEMGTTSPFPTVTKCGRERGVERERLLSSLVM